jgi:mannose-6-phosphate isomerase-like protein (cupin superfamily)
MGVNLPLKVPMFPKTHKVWGFTQSIALSDRPMHVAFATLNKGGYSSKHQHENHFNRFYIVSGSLQITIWRNKQESIILNTGDCLDVEPGVLHRMKALENTSLVEIYWTEDIDVDLDPSDIIRYDDGGIDLTTDTDKFLKKYFEQENQKRYMQGTHEI